MAAAGIGVLGCGMNGCNPLRPKSVNAIPNSKRAIMGRARPDDFGFGESAFALLIYDLFVFLVVSRLNYTRDYFAATCTTDFKLASPFSKSPPTILSMFMNRQNAFEMKLLSPVMLHVTEV